MQSHSVAWRTVKKGNSLHLLRTLPVTASIKERCRPTDGTFDRKRRLLYEKTLYCPVRKIYARGVPIFSGE
jgi:hypothetical protein